MIIAFANQKGGVGKTTSVLNSGWALAQRQRRVLLVDLDPQASLTAMLGIDAADANLASVLGITERGTTDINSIIRPIGTGLDLVPGDILLSRTELGLVVRASREHQLARALAPLRNQYDLILIDAPPSLGMLTINALVAAQWVIIPTLLDALALRGLGLFVETLAEVQGEYDQVAQVLGVLPTLADLRTVHARDILAALRNRPDLRLFDTIIPRSIRFSEAALAQQAIAQYDPTNTGAVAYAALAEEILARA
jgi:chromosome partitioning protein